MSKDEKQLRVDGKDLRLARSIAGLKGVTLKKYFSMKVEEDAVELPKQIMMCGSLDEFLGIKRKKK